LLENWYPFLFIAFFFFKKGQGRDTRKGYKKTAPFHPFSKKKDEKGRDRLGWIQVIERKKLYTIKNTTFIYKKNEKYLC